MGSQRVRSLDMLDTGEQRLDSNHLNGVATSLNQKGIPREDALVLAQVMIDPTLLRTNLADAYWDIRNKHWLALDDAGVSLP